MIYMFLAHFLADWVVQSVETGREKSNKFSVLLLHISQIFLVMFFAGCFFLDPITSLKLSFFNAVTHFCIDGVIWKFYKLTVVLRNRNKTIEELKKEYKYWIDPAFGWTLGFDQCLHFIFIHLIYNNYLENIV